MLGIKVTIERFTLESQPGWVECRFADAAGTSHVFEEKVPVVSDEDLDAGSVYPRAGVIGCQVVGACTVSRSAIYARRRGQARMRQRLFRWPTGCDDGLGDQYLATRGVSCRRS